MELPIHSEYSWRKPVDVSLVQQGEQCKAVFRSQLWGLTPSNVHHMLVSFLFVEHFQLSLYPCEVTHIHTLSHMICSTLSSVFNSVSVR